MQHDEHRADAERREKRGLAVDGSTEDGAEDDEQQDDVVAGIAGEDARIGEVEQKDRSGKNDEGSPDLRHLMEGEVRGTDGEAGGVERRSPAPDARESYS